MIDYRLTTPNDDAGGVGSRCRRGDLLAEYGPYGHLGSVDAARNSTAFRPSQQRAQRGIATKTLVNRKRVGVEVKQPAAAGDRSRQITHR
jgi:hypothetical protein